MRLATLLVCLGAVLWALDGAAQAPAQASAHQRSLDAYELLLKGKRPASFELFKTTCDQGDALGCLLYAHALQTRDAQATDLDPARVFPLARISALESECGKSDHFSCLAVAQASQWGLTGPADEGRMRVFFRKSCDLLNPYGCYELAAALARQYRAEIGTLKSDDRNRILAQIPDVATRSCKAGAPGACLLLAHEYGEGGLLTKSPQKVFEFTSKACELGDPMACATQGDLYMKGVGVAAAIDKAGDSYSRACELGHQQLCLATAAGYLKGSPWASQPPKALELYEHACKQGSGEGCFEEGRLYLQGLGTAPAPDKAYELFMTACEYRYDHGCAEILHAFTSGKVPQFQASRPRLARLEAACLNGSREACFNAGYCYSQGIVVGRSPVAAFAKYMRACELGSGGGCYFAAIAHQTGAGAEKSPEKAQALLQKACELKQAKACEALKKP